MAPPMTAAQTLLIKRFAKETPNVFKVLAKSIAPSVYGHDIVKEALLCQVISYIPYLKIELI